MASLYSRQVAHEPLAAVRVGVGAVLRRRLVEPS